MEAKFAVFSRQGSRAEYYGIGRHLNRTVQDVVLEHDRKSGAVYIYPGRIFLVVAGKKNAFAPCLGIVILEQAVHPHISIQDHDVHIGIEFFQLARMLHRALTANTAAVRVIVIPRADALDHDDSIPGSGPGRFVTHEFIQFELGHDAAVFAVAKFFGLIFTGAGGQNGNAVADFLCPSLRRFRPL